MMTSTNYSGGRSLAGTCAPGSRSEFESKSSRPHTGKDVQVSSGKSHWLSQAFEGAMTHGQQLLSSCREAGIKVFVYATLIQQAGGTQTPSPSGSTSLVTPTPTLTQTGTLLPSSRSGNITFGEDLIRELVPHISEFIASGGVGVAGDVSRGKPPELWLDYERGGHNRATEAIFRGLSEHVKDETPVGVYNLDSFDSPAGLPAREKASAQFPNLQLREFAPPSGVYLNSQSAGTISLSGRQDVEIPVIAIPGLTTTDSPLHVMVDSHQGLAPVIVDQARQYGGWVTTMPLSVDQRGSDIFGSPIEGDNSVVMFAPATQRAREAFERIMPMLNNESASVLYFEPPTPTPSPTSTPTPTPASGGSPGLGQSERRGAISGGVIGGVLLVAGAVAYGIHRRGQQAGGGAPGGGGVPGGVAVVVVPPAGDGGGNGAIGGAIPVVNQGNNPVPAGEALEAQEDVQEEAGEGLMSGYDRKNFQPKENDLALREPALNLRSAYGNDGKHFQPKENDREGDLAIELMRLNGESQEPGEDSDIEGQPEGLRNPGEVDHSRSRSSVNSQPGGVGRGPEGETGSL